MPVTLLRTKLYVPPVRPNLVSRPQLIDRLNQGLQLGHKLTLISAPAGFGKSTLTSAWVAGCDRPFAWLSLDESDGDLNRFLTYFVAALQTVAPALETRTMEMLESAQPAPAESILTTLLNEIAAIPQEFALVLDDYHVVDTPPVDQALTFMLEHQPPQMHLVITTREDPNLPLARLRVRGQLTELRVADLRFTPAEASQFFNLVMGLDLSAEEIAALETRTEGWIAGLQLAALSMRGREDVQGFIQAFAGDNRYVVDYLVEEVLHSQPEHVRRFLLQTSILDSLSGPLCTAVTGQEDGRGMLEKLERGNLFIIPLDDKRHWFRYHHLFADVLYTHMMEDQPNQAPSLHQRASRWYEQNDMLADAARHALAAEDFERAAGFIELVWRAMERSLQSATWLRWVKALPDELIRTRPVLSVGYAWALLDAGELDAAEARLNDAEQWLDTTGSGSERPAAQMVVVDENEFRTLPGTIASARTYGAQARGDLDNTVRYARQALDLLPEDAHLRRAVPGALLGLAYWANGELEAAYQALSDSMTAFQKAGNILLGITGTFGLAEIRAAQGRLRDALTLYEHTLQLVTAKGEPAIRGTADLHLGLSELYREQGNLDAADKHLLQSEALGKRASQAVYEYHLCLAQARRKETEEDLDGALMLLDQAERLFQQIHIPDLRPAAVLKVRVLLAQGKLNEVAAWAHKRELSVDDDLSYLREFEHINLARLLIAQYRNDGDEGAIQQAVGLLARLLQAAETGGRMGSAIEILAQQALAYHAQGEVPAALASLERALTLAEPEGYVRLFVDEGEPMAELLQAAAKQGIAGNYVGRLLAAFEGAAGSTTAAQPLPDPLSERELDVLKLLATELSGPEIASELMISLNTMRTHTKNIYSKLGVNSRRTAVRRAEELDLL
jgi:LuxR family maltose regulon positive regulatory protein